MGHFSLFLKQALSFVSLGGVTLQDNIPKGRGRQGGKAFSRMKLYDGIVLLDENRRRLASKPPKSITRKMTCDVS